MTPARLVSNDEYITQLALKAGRGDQAALTEFVRLTQKDVWRLVAHLGGVDAADDLTQETYLRVMGALPRFAARSSARTWLLSLARRVWVDSVRHDSARPKKSAMEVENAAEQFTTGESWSELADARVLLEQLPEERREALILTQVLGYSYAEAAESQVVAWALFAHVSPVRAAIWLPRLTTATVPAATLLLFRPALTRVPS